MKIKFKRDTSFRKQFFVPDSFAHPAKMDAQLLIWIVEHYTQPSEVVLDPMAGSGTMMLACTLGRNVVMVELEDKFCKMMADNWNEVQMRPQLGSAMGTCRIIQGDARQLDGLFDKVITSPPFAAANQRQDLEFLSKIARDQSAKYRSGENKGHFASPEAIARYYKKQSIESSPGNISNLPYGQIDKIVTSPPYSDEPTISESYLKIRREIGRDTSKPSQRYRKYDSIITSPPYEEAQSGGGIAKKGYQGNKHGPTDLVGKRSYMPEVHGQTEGNIGNLKSDSYLEAMLQVYQQCHKVLRPCGLMILVTKNFIRDKKVIRLDTDTIRLCEQAGFSFLERHYRKLTAQSFWRTIYHQKYPGVEKIEFEDVLVFTSKP